MTLIKSDRVITMNEIQDEARELFARKNADYGDSFADYGPVGVLVRMGDKIKRLASVSKKGISLVNDEKLRDTLLDLHNYAAMAIMLMDEREDELDGYTVPRDLSIDKIIRTTGELIIDSDKTETPILDIGKLDKLNNLNE